MSNLGIDTAALARLMKERDIDAPALAKMILLDTYRVNRIMKIGTARDYTILDIASALNVDLHDLLGYHGRLSTGQSLRLTRLEAEMTNGDLSAAAGVKGESISGYERDVIPSLEKAHAIAKALDKSIEEVFFRTVK